MRGAQLLPSFSRLCPGVGSAPGKADAAFDADRHRITSRITRVMAHAVQRLFAGLIGRKLWEPAIGQATHAPDHSLGSAAQPDGNGTLNGEGVEAGVGDLVPAALEIHDLLGP